MKKKPSKKVVKKGKKIIFKEVIKKPKKGAVKMAKKEEKKVEPTKEENSNVIGEAGIVTEEK